MKKFNVYNDGRMITVVEAERVFVSEGRLSFYNVSVRTNVAGFAPGAWSYYQEVKP